MTKTYCAAPWRGLHINLDGDIRLCCAGEQCSFGNIKTDKLDCLTKSQYLREIRCDVNSGKLHATYCQACSGQIGRGEREWFLENHPDIDYDSVSVDEPHQFQSIDVRWNNTCNLACTYCSSYFSSTWAQIQKIRDNQPPVRQYDDIIDQIQNHKTSIKTLMLVGGEPLLIPQNERLLSVADQDTTVVLITNLAVSLRSNRVFRALELLPRVNWNVSLENIAARFEFVRRGADWSLLTETLDILDRLFPRHTVSISAIYHVFNCTRLREFLVYMHDRNINVNWNTIGQDYLDPRFHDQSLRQLALQEIEAVFSDPFLKLSQSETIFFKQIEKHLTQDQYAQRVQAQFNNHIGQDTSKFLELWPELESTLA
jgi:uncharacterized Fe-S cluster-containing radical SAM superfamily protein